MYNKDKDFGVKYAQVGIDNFRDLGGITVKGGLVLRDDMIFRSGAIHGLSEQNKTELDKLGIDCIFDLRSYGEAEDKPDYVPQGAQYVNSPAARTRGKMVVNPADVVKMIPIWLPSGILRSAYRLKLKQWYRKFPFNNPAYRKVFDAMDEGKKLLFHCTAGKDRTGIASMLVLLALGADVETVMKDYLLSNLYRKEPAKQYVEQFARYKHYPKYRKILPMTCFVDKVYFNKAYNRIIRKYGNVKTFLLKEYDIDEVRVAKWLQLYAS